MNISITVDIVGTGKVHFNRIEKLVIENNIVYIQRYDDSHMLKISLDDIHSIKYN